VPAGRAAPDTTIVPRATELGQCNGGDASCFLAAAPAPGN